MPILSISVSHRRAPLEVLERVAIGEDAVPKAYRRLMDGPAVREGVLLSTCNRVEAIAEVESYHPGLLDLKCVLADGSGLPDEVLAEVLEVRYGDEAVEHLFTVASGLDSMVLGEPQILAQVRAAFRRAEEEGAAGPVSADLFRAAVRTGRRVRAETAIGASPAAFVEAGAVLAERALGGLAGRPAAVVGAGEMARTVVSHLRERNVGPVRVVGRSPDRARALATRSGGEAAGLDALERTLAEADLVVCCTGAAGLVVHEEQVRAALRRRERGRRLFLLDLAVPRDVDPRVAAVPSVRLADLEDLRGALNGHEHGQEAARARALVEQEVSRFRARRRSARLAPLLRELQRAGERARTAELERAAGRLARLSPDDRAAVEAMAQGIVAKLLHRPIVRLREQGQADGDALARAAADLFGLEWDPDTPR